MANTTGAQVLGGLVRTGLSDAADMTAAPIIGAANFLGDLTRGFTGDNSSLDPNFVSQNDTEMAQNQLNRTNKTMNANYPQTQGLTSANGQLNPDQQTALDAIAQKNKELYATSLQKALKSSADEHAQTLVETHGPDVAMKVLLGLTGGGSQTDASVNAAPSSNASSPNGDSPGQDIPTKAVGQMAGTATDAEVDPRSVQSSRVLANNEQIKQDAMDVLHPKSWFGKVLNGIPFLGAMSQAATLHNLNSALQIGGGDPQGEYYKAYSGTLKQIMTGDKPLDSAQLAELTAGQRAAGLKAISDGQVALNDALKGTVQTIDIMSKNKSVPENVKAMGGTTARMQEGYKNAQGILERLQNLNEVTKGLAANPIQFNKKGAVTPEADTKTNFNSIDEAKAAGVAPGTVVTIGGKKYKAQ